MSALAVLARVEMSDSDDDGKMEAGHGPSKETKEATLPKTNKVSKAGTLPKKKKGALAHENLSADNGLPAEEQAVDERKQKTRALTWELPPDAEIPPGKRKEKGNEPLVSPVKDSKPKAKAKGKTKTTPEKKEKQEGCDDKKPPPDAETPPGKRKEKGNKASVSPVKDSKPKAKAKGKTKTTPQKKQKQEGCDAKKPQRLNAAKMGLPPAESVTRADHGQGGHTYYNMRYLSKGWASVRVKETGEIVYHAANKPLSLIQNDEICREVLERLRRGDSLEHAVSSGKLKEHMLLTAASL